MTESTRSSPIVSPVAVPTVSYTLRRNLPYAPSTVAPPNIPIRILDSNRYPSPRLHHNRPESYPSDECGTCDSLIQSTLRDKRRGEIFGVNKALLKTRIIYKIMNTTPGAYRIKNSKHHDPKIHLTHSNTSIYFFMSRARGNW